MLFVFAARAWVKEKRKDKGGKLCMEVWGVRSKQSAKRADTFLREKSQEGRDGE